MNNIEIVSTLATNPRFTIFEGFSRDLEIPVILKLCPFSKFKKAEFFIRSALMKAKDKVYSQPLLFVFADVIKSRKNTLICFGWSKGKILDPEILSDQRSTFPPGTAGYQNTKIIYQNPYTDTEIQFAQCMILQKKVVLKVSKGFNILDLNSTFKEALTQAKCTHPNICEFLDFRLFRDKQGRYSAYIVMEKLDNDIIQEIHERSSADQPYNEAELMDIFQDVVAGLIFMKSQNISQSDIKPHNIMRSLRGVKLIDFGSAWQKGLYSRTSDAAGTTMYMSPEALKTMANPEFMHDPFESDVFSLGMTMLHIAALKLPDRSPVMSNSELEALLQPEIQALTYSNELKRLLTTMLSINPSERPSLKSIRERIVSIKGQVSPKSKEAAQQLTLAAYSSYNDEKYARAAQMFAAADVYYSLLPHDQDTANNLSNWGKALAEIGDIEEAITKYEKADVIFSTFFPHEIDTANNLYHWGVALHMKKRDIEAVTKIRAADSICSHFLFNRKGSADSIHTWALIQLELRTNWAAAASSGKPRARRR